MKQNLQLRISQNLALTPQLQQSIRLLQLSTLELTQELEAILQENPLLEMADGEEGEFEETSAASEISTPASAEEASSFDVATQKDITAPSETLREELHDELGGVEGEQPNLNEEFSPPEFEDSYEEFGSTSSWDESGRSNHDDDDSDFTRQDTHSISLREHLIDQMQLAHLSQRDMSLVKLLLDSINDDGYLELDLQEISEQLPPELEVELLELETALKLIQNLDPIGVGARDLRECLLIQLQRLDTETLFRVQAMNIVKDHLALLANKDFVKLRKVLACDEQTLKGAQQLIRQQNPKPGSAFSSFSHDHFIQHDVVVKKIKGIWIATLNDGAIPKLRINQMYADILKRNRENSGQYLQSQMQEAKWMIKNIQQRFSTILRVSQAIVDRQRNFFEHGDIAMRPLVLREIAEELDLHESTVSRVTTHKYMLTPRGVYELKYFFGSSVATDAGGSCSATAIRALIKQMVAEENPKKPLSDNQITDTLAQQGIVVARRTIAKYRESLSIPPANLRKSL
ncbi:RNA polymerase factor sigma-54 [Methylophilus aquaticus]|uniref:RNA polymerase sigma-54 factor n=1 Tax=Methylophilus aquaticus TaxID=1971610 RepID=A0ABT9JQT2_9PROT|nr:RNA polymerase factor sigma-54 [Methylophilus aquaticus]MDP8566486.1 RNA polymerase factor sigma-54 [Methylophilus aquaticus]